MAHGYLAVKNFEHFQHYKTRNPPWIKLYREFLTDYALRKLTPEARLLMAACYLLAAETNNRIPHDCGYLTERVVFTVNEAMLTSLTAEGFLFAAERKE